MKKVNTHKAEGRLVPEFQKLPERWPARLKHRDLRGVGEEIRMEEEGRGEILRPC